MLLGLSKTIMNILLSCDNFLLISMVELVCENCYYKGDKIKFEASSDYCKECLSDHGMCPKCGAPYHSATITD